MYGVLSGLTKGPESQAYARGLDADIGTASMKRAMGQHQIAQQNMEQQSRIRQAGNQNSTEAARNQAAEWQQEGEIANRRRVFDTNMNYDYAGLNRQRQLEAQQSLLHHAFNAPAEHTVPGWYGGMYGYGYGGGFRGFGGGQF